MYCGCDPSQCMGRNCLSPLKKYKLNDEIRTYDNVTYQYQMHDCWTLISADCSENPMFAVFMKKDTSSKLFAGVFSCLQLHPIPTDP